MSCPSWQWHRTGSSWFPIRTLPVAPLWCDLGFVPNSRGNKAAANLRPTDQPSMAWSWTWKVCPKFQFLNSHFSEVDKLLTGNENWAKIVRSNFFLFHIYAQCDNMYLKKVWGQEFLYILSGLNINSSNLTMTIFHSKKIGSSNFRLRYAKGLSFFFLVVNWYEQD